MKEYKVNIIYPKSEKDMNNLKKRIAKAHIEAISNCIKELSCPNEQKVVLIERIIEKSTA